MNFKDVDIKTEYRIPKDNITAQLYIPLLKKSVLYRRSVGFFTSSALLEIVTGISHLVNNNGKIQLIVSPYLDEEDVEAINKGYEIRNDIVERTLLKYITEPQNYFEEEKLNLLATLIAEEKLDIKIAFSYKNNKLGLYHEKVGIFYDGENNKVAFSGSMNESQTAFAVNYESIDVYASWKPEDAQRVKNKELAFERLWNNLDSSAKIMEFPEAVKNKLLEYKKENVNFQILYEDEEKMQEQTNEIDCNVCNLKRNSNMPMIPEDVHFYKYQDDAIEKWKMNNYRGIFDMATGTGKTYTGLGAITRLFNDRKGKLAVIIVCPYKHLVNQWVEDIIKFNMCPIIGHSESNQKDFKKRLKNAIIDYNLDIRKFFCFICTNRTYTTKGIQEEIKKIKGDILLVVDEVHNFGAETMVKTLDDKYTYRLGLSATLERHNDEEGTDLLKRFFGKKCIEFSLEEAIQKNVLTPYRYYPIVVSLDADELEEYKEITNEIRKCIVKDKNGKIKLNERGIKLASQRARIVAGAKEKVEMLKKVIKDYKDDNHLLIYCGTATLIDEEEDDEDQSEKRQIDIVTAMLHNEYDMKVSQFTSREKNSERERLKKEFADGKNLQALIAIRCLDEGVNIPQIKTAFILASTTNPKEYIQRRGRVLRKYPGKQFAVIYDFVTLPRKIENVWNLTEEELKGEKTLARNEINRIVEFKRLALNPMDSDVIIENITNAYQLWKDKEEDM